MFTAPPEAAGFLARHHTAALSAVAAFTGIATAAAAASLWFQSFLWVDVLTLVFGAVLAAVISVWHVRHLTLALAVAATPLPGLLWAAPLAAGSHFGLVPVIAYGFGFASATLYAQRLLDLRLGTEEGEAPWRASGVMLGLASLFALVWFAHSDGADAALQAVVDLIGTTISVLLFLPLLAPLLRSDEAFIADANRARERRGHFFEGLGGAAIARWSLSFTGVMLVFFVLGWFGGEPLLRSGWWHYGVTVIAVGAALGVAAGGWREGIALGLVLTLVAVTALWWRTYVRAPFGAVAALEMVALAGLFALSRARAMRTWRAVGDPPETICRHALEGSAGAVFAALGAIAAAIPSLMQAGASVIVLSLCIAGVCGTLAFPVALAALETLLPRRRSVEDVFGIRRR
jgi:hypothetical protein